MIQQRERTAEESKIMEPNSVFPSALSEVISRTTTPSSMPTVTISPPQPVRPNQLPIPNPLRPLDSRESSFNHQHLSSDQQNVDDQESTGTTLGQDLNTQQKIIIKQKTIEFRTN